jgi:hypothetical protein
MAMLYGGKPFLQTYRNLPPYVLGSKDFSIERGEFFFLLVQFSFLEFQNHSSF